KAVAALVLLTITLAGAGAIAAAVAHKDRPAVAAAPASQPSKSVAATQPDDDPLAALGAMSAALHAGDLPALRRSMLLGDDNSSKLMDAMLAWQVSRIRLNAALQRAGMKDVDVNEGSSQIELIMDLVLPQLDPADVQITGDAAVVPFSAPKFLIGDDSWENGQVRFARVDGHWRLNVRDGLELVVFVAVRDAVGPQVRHLSG